MSNSITQENAISLEEKQKLSEVEVTPDPTRDYISEAKNVSNASVKERANLVLYHALSSSITKNEKRVCQEVYNHCKKGSEELKLKGTWTITRAIYSRNGFQMICSGGILVRSNIKTRGGLLITASFVAGTPPVGAQETI
ncbi:hypothetical protein [Aquimarina sp. 2201CG5-10]|uniref:hypothetical protein n=1 Tax=Aquimarina callyspongiae TaxID=3098150 RepID=UPI002AB4E9F3|nr:hypothetical protein [Aquimarina sp. 2201CG5-10]MDY8134164.1 hypothetical protein [Aquimarina sp. 2201CG5-10]